EGVRLWRVLGITVPAGLDLDGLAGHADALADDVEREGADAVTAARLAPRLRGIQTPGSPGA
ncbi:hypothetical protein GTW08_24665, partial [Pseudonocardia sp. SID8383]|nr:hypothetical protein [Pseudonocardia sp. SID8383]